MRCTIFGTGPLGLWTASQLISQGKTVTLVNQSGKVPPYLPLNLRKGHALHRNLRIRAGNGCNADQVYQLSNKSQVVFHCAMPPYTQWPSMFPALTVGIMDGVARTQAKLIYADNLYMYGNTNGQVMTEESPLRYSGYEMVKGKPQKGKIRALMANTLLQAHQEGKLAVAIGRASDFFGPGVVNSAIGKTFFEPIIKGRAANVLGDPAQLHTLTYIKDFANALVTLSEQDQSLGQIWHVPSAPTISIKEFSKLVSAELGHPVKTRSSGKFIISLLGLFNPMIRELKETMYAWDHSYIVSHQKFDRAFGASVTPHSHAIQETLEWYLANSNKTYQIETHSVIGR